MTNYRKKYKTKSKLATDKIKEQEKEIDKLVYVIGEQRKQLEELQEKLDAAATGQQYQGDGAEAMQERIKELEGLVECEKFYMQYVMGKAEAFERVIKLMTRREKTK